MALNIAAGFEEDLLDLKWVDLLVGYFRAGVIQWIVWGDGARHYLIW